MKANHDIDQVAPLSKKVHDACITAEVTEIQLQFSGGSDSGYLYITFAIKDNPHKLINHLEPMVDEWAWSVYEFSGAGDGTEYGSTITYNLVDQTATLTEWAYEKIHQDIIGTAWELADETETENDAS